MADQKLKKRKWSLNTVTPIFLLLIAIPVSMLMWAGNLAFRRFRSGTAEVIHPTRWFAAVLVPLAFAFWGYKRKSINKSGALAGLIMSFILTLSSYAFLADLIVFFVSSSQASKFKARSKEKIAAEFTEGARRNWIQAVCNAGMASLLALLYLFDSGSGEQPIDFSQDYRSSWLSAGVLGAFACANADTWASEIGTVLSNGKTFLITTGAKVPTGANGGVSWSGLVLSFLGGAAIGVGHFLTLKMFVDSPYSQWPLIPLSAAAGLFGSVLDSFLGATLQYSGLDKKKGVVVEAPGPDVQYICGYRILDNNAVNLLSTIITGLVTPRFAAAFWPR